MFKLQGRRIEASCAALLMFFLGMGAADRRDSQVSVSNEKNVVRYDEFVGPFPSWSNLKTRYGALGDGATDDTAALQRALNELGDEGTSPVLFLPSGTYRISSTLTLAFTINVSIVGEHPATTTVIWSGPAGGTMLSINGVAYSRFTRLTFNGNRKASVAVDQSWDKTRPHFDTGNEYSDCNFVDTEYGIRGGFKQHGFAETTIRRSHFVRNTKAGVALGNFNALDIWVWESTFEDCDAGITNTLGAGNFHVYNSVFRRSKVADLAMAHTGGFSARGNYSVGSRMFFSGGGTSNPATIHIQGNTVLDPTASPAIAFGNQGPGLITDNIIRSLTAAIGPVISWTSFAGADVTSVGNTFTVANPLKSNGRLTAIDDRIVARNTIAPAEPSLPPPPSNLRRQVFEVPPGSDVYDIQNLIIAAARQNGRRPVVHIRAGTYSISETITIPVGDIQLVGDGYGTILRWAAAGAGPVLRIKGPTTATLREIQIDGGGRADGVVVENADQPGSRVYMDQAQLRSGRRTNLRIRGLDHTNVQLENIGFAYSPDAVSIEVTGGPLLAGGSSTSGRTNIFSGASSGNRISFDVSGGAKVLVRDLWYESGAGPGFATIHDRAVVTIDGARISSPANGAVAAIAVKDLKGRVAVLSSHIDDRVSVSGDGAQSMVMGLAVFAEQKSSGYFLNLAAPPARAVLINSRQLSILPGLRSAASTNVGVADTVFIRNMIGHARGEMPAPLTTLPAGVTDARFFRVWVANGLNNIVLSAAR